jgi:hypothetical protein
MNCKEYGRKESWPNLRYFPSSCLEGLRKTMKTLSHDNQWPRQDLNWASPQYRLEALHRNRQHTEKLAISEYSETSDYHSRIIRFPSSVVQFLWSLSESYFNYGSRIYRFPGSIVSFSDPRRKRWIEVSLYLLLFCMWVVPRSTHYVSLCF